MTNTKGQRKRTRYQFSKAFRNKGVAYPSKHLISYKIGDYVDIVVDGSQHKGMPFRYFHGKTGKVFDVNPRSLGVSLLKPVRHRKMIKKLHVRLEHVNKSLCRQDFLNRVKENDKKKAEARKQKKIISTKRQPQGPLVGGFVKGTVDYQNPKVVSEVF